MGRLAVSGTGNHGPDVCPVTQLCRSTEANTGVNQSSQGLIPSSPIIGLLSEGPLLP